METNPSTNEPFLYKEPESDDYFAYYTHNPKLADCRGKILIYVGDDMGHYVGGAGHLGIPQPSNGADFSEQPTDHIDSLRKGAAMLGLGDTPLPTNADTHLDFQWFWGTSCTGEANLRKYIFHTDDPYKIAQRINPTLIGDDEGKLFSPKLTGKYIGCVSTDDYQAEYGAVVWKTNFFDGLEYRTVTVKSGPDDKNPQTYQLLKGTKLTIPGNIYKNVEKGTYFANWKTDDGAVCNEGDLFKIDENVTFTAQWLDAGKIPVRAVWKDGDNVDELRPDNVKLKADVDGKSSEITLSQQQGWSGIVEYVGSYPDTIKLEPDWNLVTDGKYTCKVELKEGVGYVVTFTHNPDATTTISGKVVWDDDGNAAGQRPQSVTVRLKKNGVEDQSQAVSDANGWSYGFEVPLYENGEKLSYSIDEDAVDYYNVSFEDGIITYTYVKGMNTLSVVGLVEWDDANNANGLRPEATSLELKRLSGDEVVSTTSASSSSEQPWVFEFDDVPAYDDEGNPIDDYALTPQAVPGYKVSFEAVSLYGNDPSEEDSGEITAQDEVYFRVTYTLDISKDAKEEATVSQAPEARNLDYTGKPQELVHKGFAEGGTMMYAWSEVDGPAPADEEYDVKVPTVTDSGTYYVWYKARGDAVHTDSEPAFVASSITGVGFRSHSLLLDGKIGVKFYMDLSGLTDEQRESCSVTFKVPGRGGFTSTDPFDPEDRNPQTGKLYGFTCYVNSIQMAVPIKATLVCEGLEGAEDVADEYSVARYVQWTEDNRAAYEAQGEAGEATLALVRALADYGHHVQPFLSKSRNWAIGDDYPEMPAAAGFDGSGAEALSEADVAAAQEALAARASAWDVPDGSGVAKATFSLGLNAGTDIFLYFTMKGDARVESASAAKKPAGEGPAGAEPAGVALCPDGRYLVTVGNIPAHELATEYDVAVATSGGEVRASVSALSYASALFASEAYGDDPDARSAVASLYRYWEAADGYLKAAGEGA